VGEATDRESSPEHEKKQHSKKASLKKRPVPFGIAYIQTDDSTCEHQEHHYYQHQQSICVFFLNYRELLLLFLLSLSRTVNVCHVIDVALLLCDIARCTILIKTQYCTSNNGWGLRQDMQRDTRKEYLSCPPIFFHHG